MRKQKATGRTKDGATFPLCMKINEQTSEEKGMNSADNVLYSVVIWVSINKIGRCVILLHFSFVSCTK